MILHLYSYAIAIHTIDHSSSFSTSLRNKLLRSGILYTHAIMKQDEGISLRLDPIRRSVNRMRCNTYRSGTTIHEQMKANHTERDLGLLPIDILVMINRDRIKADRYLDSFKNSSTIIVHSSLLNRYTLSLSSIVSSSFT